MVDMKVKSKLTDQDENKQTIPVKIFKITDIPDVMEKKGWKIAASFMRKWFNDSFYEMTQKEKLNKIDISTIEKQHILDDLEFEWLLISSSRIKPIYDNFVIKVSNIIEYDDFLGRKKQITNQLSNGLCYILSRGVRLGFVMFYMRYVIIPITFLSAFIKLKHSSVIFGLVAVFMLYSWYETNPLRVILMLISCSAGYVLVILLKYVQEKTE